MQNTLWMLLGAALVSLGVIASALADRIRGLRISRDATPRERASRAPFVPAHVARTAIPVVEAAALAKQARAPRPEPKVSTDGSDDVIAVLMASGYKKPVATEATWACSAAERATVESWTVAALRLCARGGRA